MTDLPNPYIQYYNNVHQYEQEEIQYATDNSTQPRSISMILKEGPDIRRYNTPSYEDDVAAVFVGDSDDMPRRREICVYPTSSDALSKLPGPIYAFQSQNTFFLSQNANLSSDYLHNIDLPHLPLYDLKLKVGCSIRLLAPLTAYPQISVGSRLKITNINQISDTIIAKYDSEYVNICRMDFNSEHNGIQFLRYQFPIKLETHLHSSEYISHELQC